MVPKPRVHAPALVFVAVAVGIRLAFWLATDRLWEDALITTQHARSVFTGDGLTHHPGEPRVHGFTSALSVLIPLVGGWASTPRRRSRSWSTT